MDDNAYNVPITSDISGFQRAIKQAINIWKSFASSTSAQPLKKELDTIEKKASRTADEIEYLKVVMKELSKMGIADNTSSMASFGAGEVIESIEGVLSEAKSIPIVSEIQRLADEFSTIFSSMQSGASVDGIVRATERIRNNIGAITELQTDNKDLQAEINALFFMYKTALEEAEDKMQGATSDVSYLYQESNKLPSIWERIRNTIIGSQEGLDELPDTGEEVKQMFVRIGKEVKKIALGVLGVRSAFMVFRRAVSTALSNNIELSQKFNAIWVALGNALTPLLERVANLILRAFSYLNVFVKTVSGGRIDLLAKTSKSASSTASSLKEANKQLAGFDELNNLDDSTSGGGGIGDVGATDPFAGIDLDTTWTDRIQTFGEWCKSNIPTVVGLIGGIALAFSDVGKQFKFIEKIGIVLIFAGLGEIIQGISDFIQGVFNGDLESVVKGFGEIALGIGLVIAGFELLTGTFTLGSGLIIRAVVAIRAYIIKHKDEIAEKLRQFWENFKRKTEELKNNVRDKATAIADGFKTRVEQVKGFFVGLKDKAVEVVTTMAEKLKNKAEDIKKNFKTNLANGIIGFGEGMVNSMIKGINFIIRAFNKIRFTVPDWVPIIGGRNFGFNLTEHPLISVPRLDTGTSYVPNDQLAMIHKGEAVIPKKFNSQEYFGNNGEVLEKLDRFMDIVESIDFNTYLDGKKVSREITRLQRQNERVMGGAY